MRLDLVDLLRVQALRRVRRGGVVMFEGRFYYHGRPTGVLLADAMRTLVDQELPEVAEPDSYSMCQVRVTDAGNAQYRALCRRQRSVTAATTTTESPAGPSGVAGTTPPVSSQPCSRLVRAAGEQ